MPRSSTTSAGKPTDDPDAVVHTRVAGEVLASLDHELRSPLNAIAGLTELLRSQRSGPLTEKQQDYVDLIAEAGDHLLQLLEDLVRLAAPDGTWTDAGDDTPASATIERVAAMVRESAVTSGVVLGTRADQGMGACAGDPRALRRVLMLLTWSVVGGAPEEAEVVLEARERSGRGVLVVRSGTDANADLDVTGEAIEAIAEHDPVVGAAVAEAQRLGIAVGGARAGNDVVYEITVPMV